MLEPMEAGERNAIEAWRNSRPERDTAGADEPTAVHASTHHRGMDAPTTAAPAPTAAAPTPTHPGIRRR
jgi:hypothetical protein